MTSDIQWASPPDLSNPSGWFDYYDRDKSGTLDQEEVVYGLLHTLHSVGNPQQSVDSVRETVRSIWPAFDHDGSGAIDKWEFSATGGMAEALLAATAQERNTARSSKDRGFGVYVPQAYVPGSSSNNAPAPAAPMPSDNSGFWECSRCTFINKAGEGSCKACGGSPPAGAASLPPPIPPHAGAVHVPPPIPQQSTQKMKMVRVNIPPGMKPGQQLRVLTDSSGMESVVVSIPHKRQWKTHTRHGQPYFDIQVPDKQQQVQKPIIVQGTFVGGANNGRSSTASGSYSSSVTTTANTGPPPAWQSWEQFQGYSYKPVPLGVHKVSCVPVSSLSMIQASGRRRALLIGINYKGTRAALRGCVNDANAMEKLLIRHGFPNDSRHMVKLVDEGSKGRNYLPTRANILKACEWLVQGASEGDVLFFHYSGHGAQIPDKSGHEADGYNETILPMDYKTGQITDDVLWGTLVYPLPAGVRLTAVMDCCHSGTGLDLPYECNIRTGQWKEDINPAHAKADVILFSGCEDSQTSADAFDQFQAGGAMTQSFIRAYNENPMALYPEFMAGIHRHLRKRGFKQRPQLTASQQFDVRSRVFSFVDGIQPNHNPQVGRIKRRHVHPGRAGYQKNNMNDLLFSTGGAIALAGLASLFLGGDM